MNQKLSNPSSGRSATTFSPREKGSGGFRWSFYEIADVSPLISLAAITFFLNACLVIVWLIFKTGYRIRQ